MSPPVLDPRPADPPFDDLPMSSLPVVVIRAGPVGLAAAARLAEHGLPFPVLERGPAAGASIAQRGHVRVFSPWRYLIDAAARRLLHGTSWTAPADDLLPTGADLVDLYLRHVARRTRSGRPDPVRRHCGGDQSRGDRPGEDRRPREPPVRGLPHVWAGGPGPRCACAGGSGARAGRVGGRHGQAAGRGGQRLLRMNQVLGGAQ